MGYSLEQFGADCNKAIKDNRNLEGVRQALEKALVDEEFVAANIGPDESSPRKLLYEDSEFGFCIFAHSRGNKAESPPHDHGPGWAIYGQVAGVTSMTEWRLVSKPDGDKPGTVEAVEVYDLKPGMARVYDVGDLHSPSREHPTRLVRIEGMNMDNVKRDKFVAVEAVS